MTGKPIFVATHPRACSTAFERVFMTRHKTLQCVHEPFGDAYYFGPERLAERYESDAEARKESGYSESTYRTIFDSIAREHAAGKRTLIKDMAQYWIPPNDKPAALAPSLCNHHGTQAEPGNPTVIPADLLATYHFTFLIRHPRHSIPSYYRCTIPPLDALTGFYQFRPDEAGYAELRGLFDYLRSVGQIGPRLAGQAEAHGGEGGGVEICVIDADDLLDNPSGVIEAFCKSTGIAYEPEMLVWDTEEDQARAKEAFAKWKGFHEDALDSDRLRARSHKKPAKSDEELFEEWRRTYGDEAARVIRNTVAENVEHYEHLKQFAIRL